MAAMSTNLTFSGNTKDTFIYALDGHTAQVPSLLIASRKNGNGPTGNIESTFELVQGTHDSEGVLIASRDIIEMRFKYPKHGDFNDMVSLRAIAIDMLSSDELWAWVEKQTPPSP